VTLSIVQPPILPYLTILGPVIGPVAGGFITQTIGIKWVFIVIASKRMILLPTIPKVLMPSNLFLLSYMWRSEPCRHPSITGNLRTGHTAQTCCKVC